jgi:hypothetical protein
MVNLGRPPLPPNRPYHQPFNYLEYVKDFDLDAHVATPLWAKCEDETHTPESGDLEFSGTPKNSELDCRGQNTLHRGVLYINGKVLKCRCPK